MGKHVISDLWQMQSLPLEAKIRMTKYRIRQWVEYYGEDGVYVSFSGGKDSTVLLDLVRQMYSNVTAVFVDTGLEYPEIREFVKTFSNEYGSNRRKISSRLLPNMAILSFLKKSLTRWTGQENICKP